MFGAVNQFKGSIANNFVGTKNVGSVVQVIHNITDLKKKIVMIILSTNEK